MKKLTLSVSFFAMTNATVPPLDELVAAEVRAELGRQEMSKAALARELGVTEMWVNRRLKAHVEFTLTELQAVAAVLGVSFWQFLERKHEAMDERLAAMEASAGNASAQVMDPKVPRQRRDQPSGGKQLEL